MKTVNIMIADNFSRDVVMGFAEASIDNWPGVTIHGSYDIPDDGSTSFLSHGDSVLGTFLSSLDIYHVNAEEVNYEIYLVDTGIPTNAFTSDFQADVIEQLEVVDFDVVSYSFVSMNNTPEFIAANQAEMDDGAYIISSLPNQGQEGWGMDNEKTMDAILGADDHHISVGAVARYGAGIWVHRVNNSDEDYMDAALEGSAEMIQAGWFGTSFAVPKMAAIMAELIGTGESNDIGEIVLIDPSFAAGNEFGDILVSDGALMN